MRRRFLTVIFLLTATAVMAADVKIGDRVVVRFTCSDEAGVMPETRAKILSENLQRYLRDNDGSDIVPTFVSAEAMVVSTKYRLVTVSFVDGMKNFSSPTRLAFEWANNIRSALGQPILSESYFAGLSKLYNQTNRKIMVVSEGKRSTLWINGVMIGAFYNVGNWLHNERAQLAKLWLENVLVSGEGKGEDIVPVAAKGGNTFAIKAKGKVVSNLNLTDAKKNNTTLWQLTLDWVNRMRSALGAKEFSQETVASQGTRRGWASWYGGIFHGRRTSSGERFDKYGYSVAHRTLPFGTQLLLTRPDTGKSVVVRVNDRGPFIHNRILDLSQGAAQYLGVIGKGVARLRMDIITLGKTKKKTKK